MDYRIWSRVLGSLVVAGALSSVAGEAAAQGCSNATLRGTYGIQLEGTRPVPPAMGGGTEAVIGVVTRTYDGQGTFTQIDNIKGSVTGITPDRPGSGTYQVNADCSGSTDFQPAPGTTIAEKIVIVEGGAEIWSITTTPLVMVTAVQKRIDVSAAPVTPPVTACLGPDPFASIPGLIGECVNGGWVPRPR
jgi:hypothetical protein